MTIPSTVQANEQIATLERSLQKLQDELNTIHHALSSVLVVLDEKRCISRWNARSEQIFGLQADEPIGKDLFDLGLFHDPQTLANALSSCKRYGKSVRIDETPFRRPDGTTGVLGLTVNPISSTSGDFNGFLVLGKDLTEIKAAEYSAPHAKLESIGRLAAGIAHELNTPIQYVGDNLHFLRDSFEKLSSLLEIIKEIHDGQGQDPPSEVLVSRLKEALPGDDLDFLHEEVPRAISESLDGTQRVAKIVQAMKEFSHPNVKAKSLNDINKALETTITVARNEWKYVAQLSMELDPNLPEIPCLPGELNQVFLNLIVNAAHAIEEVVGRDGGATGAIKISTASDKRFVEIRIQDTGSGIPDEYREKVFDMFFTTKKIGRGTGQGLAIAHDVIINKHGGTLSFETETGKGTTFFIRLPIDPGEESVG